MAIRKIVALLLAAAAALLASCAPGPRGDSGAAGATYVNPVLERDFPDPAVLTTAEGWFYAYATQSASADRMLNIQVARSRDLVHWEQLGDALPEKPRWAASTQKFWAPHVLQDAALGRYFMYYSAEPDRSAAKCLAVATAAAPEGPFVDAGEPLLCGERSENIDPMAFDDPRTGRRLLYWGSAARPIRVRELAPDRLRFAADSTARELVFPDAARDYHALVEAAWVTYRGGRYYLFYSGDRCCGVAARYALMVARASDALGPFEPLATPILERSESWHAPGHNSVVTDDAGADWILYHAMRTPPQRLMLLDRIVWRDGWPRVAGARPSALPRPVPWFSNQLP